jgi:hypothetical protein
LQSILISYTLALPIQQIKTLLFATTYHLSPQPTQ